jgi:hypothetical protein
MTAPGSSSAAAVARQSGRACKKGSQLSRANTAPGGIVLPDFKTPTNISFSAGSKMHSTHNTMLKSSRALQMHKRKLSRNSSVALRPPSLATGELEETWHQIQVGSVLIATGAAFWKPVHLCRVTCCSTVLV